jgi:2-hydroxychromene-2-carboxylate isomerase
VDAAVALGVFGVPTFIADGEMFWGNDHICMMEQWITKGSFRR